MKDIANGKKHNFKDYLFQLGALILISQEKQGKNIIKQFILELCILVFWNKEKVNAFKTKEECYFMLGNHKHDILPHVIVTSDSEEIPFTAVNYTEILKLTLNQNILLDKIKISCLKNCRYDRSQRK